MFKPPNTAPFGDASRRAPDPRANTGVIVVEFRAFSGRFLGLNLVPSKRRCLVPPTALLLHQLANVENGRL